MPSNNLEYITVPIKTNPTELETLAFERLKELIPGWEPADGDLTTIAIKTVCYIMAEARDVASVVPLAIFRYFGQTIAKVPPLEAVPANALTDWKFADSLGHVIPALTPLVMTNPQGEKVGFQVLSEFNVPVGINEVKSIPIGAIVPGENGNHITGTIEPAQNLPFVSAIVLNATTPETTGGSNEESDLEYLNRLSALLTTIAPRAITAKDFSLLATSIEGIHRCLAISGYNFETSKAGEEKTVGLVPIDITGKAVSAAIQKRLKEYMQEIREIGYIVTVGSPTVTKVDVKVKVHCREGTNKELAEKTIKEAIENYLKAETWGQLPGGGIPSWLNEPAVRQGSLAAIINGNPAVSYTLLPEICEHGKTLENKDFTLPGVAPLPEPGTITVEVEIP